MNKPDRVSASALESANSTLASLDDEEQQLNLDEVQLKKEVAASRGAMIKAEVNFLEGVEVRVGTKRATTTKDRSGGTYRLKDDELIFE